MDDSEFIDMARTLAGAAFKKMMFFTTFFLGSRVRAEFLQRMAKEQEMIK